MRMKDKWNPEFDADESLEVFFASIGLRDFWVGWEGGAYGIDCGHLDPGKLDRSAWQAVTRIAENRRDWLRHTTESPRTSGGPMGGGVSFEITSFGEVETPWAVAPDGVKHTFWYVEWLNDYFAICVETETARKLMALSELRAIFQVEADWAHMDESAEYLAADEEGRANIFRRTWAWFERHLRERKAPCDCS
ncbi:hypothetical protein LCGC14_1820960 [marine sediment metagenome]|uniref:Uncharacterized protein n=1 Tax=marine sediment metagenome TaxID=412755 RepID=A0A0F9JIJ0_9ZZZZ